MTDGRDTWWPLGIKGDVVYKGGVGDAKTIAEDRAYILVNEANTRRILVTVKKGYLFNGANMPSVLWPMFGHPFETPRDRAALLHDAAYDNKFVTRREADRLYRVCLQELGYSAARRWIEWLFVRAFGWIAWECAEETPLVEVKKRGT